MTAKRAGSLPSLLIFKMTEYIIDFASVILEASDENEAYEKARELIGSGEIEVDLIAQN